MHDNKRTLPKKSLWQKLRYAFILSTLWCLFMVLLYNNASTSNTEHAKEQMLTQAQTLYSFVLDTRNWNARHGGVYVRESEFGQPNQWIPEDYRSIAMPDGSRFVLVNPAYMSRQISESSKLLGAHFKIISTKPMRPENMADSWDVLAFERNALGEPEVYSYEKGMDGIHFRYLKPLYAIESCLQCHKNNKEDDVLGGISVSLDVNNMLKNVNTQNKSLAFAYGFMALVGSGFVGGLGFLRSRKEQLREEKEKMKDAFVANMSHDMRTPLAGIMGMTQLLRQEKDQIEQKKIVEYLHLASASLLEMVSDITDYAALNADKIHLNMASFAVRPELEQCCAIFLPQCKAKGLEFELCIAEDVPTYIVGDAFRIRQVLGNIINNAVKFTAEGKVSVSISYKDNALCLEVMDTGSGIAKDEQELIFTRFERGKFAHDTPGTGLGLAIVFDLVQLMQGSVSVKSDQDNGGKGACFTMLIPANIGQNLQNDTQNAHATPNDDTHSYAHTCILLVEDNAVTAFFVQAVLEKVGCTVHLANSGERALELLDEIKPHMVLLDMRMPGMDGLETAAQIRAYAEYAGTPLVLMSASVLDVDAQKLEELHIEKTLLKPVSAQDIINLLSEFAPKSTMPELPLFERERALEALDNDEELLAKLINIWLDDYEVRHNYLVLAIEEGQQNNICALAHAIKNSAGTLYLTRLQYEATWVENNSDADCSKLVENHVTTYEYLKKGLYRG